MLLLSDHISFLLNFNFSAEQATLTTQNPFAAVVRSQYDGSLKKKPKKNKFVQFAWCEVCKISCNSNEIYAKHLTGKKHLKNTEKAEKGKSIAGASNAQPLATDPIIGPVENPAANNPSSDDIQKTQKSSTQAPEDLDTKKRKIVESGTAADSVRTCTVCNIVCNSQTVFDSHLAGQKHAVMVKKQAVSGISESVPSLVAALPNQFLQKNPYRYCDQITVYLFSDVSKCSSCALYFLILKSSSAEWLQRAEGYIIKLQFRR